MSALNQIGLLTKLLDVAQVRHEVIARNVANVNTPGFRRQQVQFEDALATALGSGGARGVQGVEPRIVTAEGGLGRADGNNVDIDLEMGQLSKNSLLYRVYAQILAVQIGQYRSAISGRSG
jgi:flagellar basal-body rod protein FlgB